MDKCPKCGMECFDTAVAYAGGLLISIGGHDVDGDICLRNQLAQRDARIERLSVEWAYLRAGCQYAVDHDGNGAAKIAQYAQRMMDLCDGKEHVPADEWGNPLNDDSAG